MAQNELKNEEEVPEFETPAELKAGKKKNLNALLLFIDKEMVIEWMPYIFFIGFLGIVYISNAYYAEKTVRKIDGISRELKELRFEYITTKSELMYRSKQSEVAKRLTPFGINESIEPPLKIVLSSKK